MWAKKQLQVVWGHMSYGDIKNHKDCLEDHPSWQVIRITPIYKAWSSAIWTGSHVALRDLQTNGLDENNETSKEMVDFLTYTECYNFLQ